MTQITKTLSIAGIVAMATMPVMADIASTDYVQSIVNNVIPKTGTVGDVLKKTSTGFEWAAAPSVPANVLTNNEIDSEYGDIAIGEDARALDGSIAIGDYSYGSEGSIAIGIGADAGAGGIQLGAGNNNGGVFSVSLWGDDEGHDGNYKLLKTDGTIPAGRLTAANFDDGYYTSDNNGVSGQLLQTNGDGTMSWVNAPSVPEGVLINNAAGSSDGDIAIGENAHAFDSSIAIGRYASGSEQSVAIGDGAAASMGAAAIGYGARADGNGSIQLGAGTNTADSTFSVALMDIDYNTTNYRLLNPAGNIPAGRMVAGTWDDDEGMYVDNNGTAGQLLQTNGDGTMSWVNAPSAPTLASLLPELPSACNTVKCALVHDNTDGAYKWEVVKVSE